jgi:hypothetical protein
MESLRRSVSHACDELDLPVVARLKGNLPELFQAAKKRFSQMSPKLSFRGGSDRIQVWDADDFDPWESLRCPRCALSTIDSTNPTEP